MKRIRWIVILTAAVLFLGLCAFAAAEEEAEPDEWTVMIYFCGSDLESKYGFASANLDEISSVDYPVNESIVYNPDATAEEYLRDLGKVNILIETGGSREWHTPERRMNIATDALQRWRYKYYPESWEEITKTHTFHLMETLPLRSMADPETLVGCADVSGEEIRAGAVGSRQRREKHFL